MFKLERILAATLLTAVGCGGDSSTPATATASTPSVWNQNEKNSGRGADVKQGRSVCQSTVNGRQVKALADVSVTLTFQGEIAVATFDGRTCAVDFGKRVITWDDKEQAKLPENAKAVEIQFLDGALTLTADGVALPANAK